PARNKIRVGDAGSESRALRRHRRRAAKSAVRDLHELRRTDSQCRYRGERDALGLRYAILKRRARVRRRPRKTHRPYLAAEFLPRRAVRSVVLKPWHCGDSATRDRLDEESGWRPPRKMSCGTGARTPH